MRAWISSDQSLQRGTIHTIRIRLVTVGIRTVRLLHDAFYLLLEDDAYCRLRGHSLFLAFLTACFTAERSERQISDASHRAMEYIRSHLSDRITLDEIAACAGLSEARLKEKFRDEIGVNIRHYITLQLIERAEQVLMETDMPMAEIGAMLGFSSSAYFSTAFKKEVGVSPRTYRDHYRAYGRQEYHRSTHVPELFDPRVSFPHVNKQP